MDNTIIIKRKKYILSPRVTKYVLDWIEEGKNIPEDDHIKGLIYLSIMVQDSLKSTFFILPFYKKFRYIKFFFKRNISYVLNNIPIKTMIVAQGIINELEGNKKKVQEVMEIQVNK